VGANAGTLEVVITATTSGLTAGIANARTAINKAGPDLKRYAAILTGTVVAGLTASAYAFGESQKSATMLSHALKNAGESSNKALQELLDLSSELQHLSGIEDEAVQGASAIILKFGATGDELKRLTRAAVDAAAEGEDLEAVSLALGKAFQGETGRLKNYGIIIDENIPKALRYAEAIKQWEQIYGGAAAAKGKTFFGMIAIAKGDVSDYAEEIGRNLAVHVTDFVQFFIDNRGVMMKAAQDVGTSIREWIYDFRDVINWVDANKDRFFKFGKPKLIIDEFIQFVDKLTKGQPRSGDVTGALKKTIGEVNPGGFISPPTTPRKGPASLVPAGMGKAGGKDKDKDKGQTPETFAQGWAIALAKVQADTRIWSSAFTELIGGVTSTISAGFQDAFQSIADGTGNVMTVMQKMATAFRTLMFKVIADILAKEITSALISISWAKAVGAVKLAWAAATAGGETVAQNSKMGPWGWVAGLAAAAVVIAAVLAFTPFAKGGIVTGPTLGLVGEAGPEAIIPLGKGKEMGLFGGGGGKGGVTEVHLHFDGATFVDADEAKWDNIARRFIIPALAAYQDKTSSSDFRRWPTRT
jgi:hypothetical protein